MKRPLINKGVAELERLYKDARASLSSLRDLRAELDHRSVPRARALLQKVIADIERAERGGPIIQDPELKLEVLPHRPTEATEKRKQRIGDSEPRESTARPEKFTMVRPPPASGCPSAFRPQLKNDVTLGLGPSDSDVKLFRVAIAALIREMRQRHVGQQLFALEHGTLVARDVAGCSYRFAFTEDAILFEGARVELLIGRQNVAGQLTAIKESEGAIVVTTQEDFGDKIDMCVLRIDATALLQALHDRFEKIEKGEITSFRADLAGCVLRNKATTQQTTEQLVLPLKPVLNEDQQRFVYTAFAHNISWLWGPPGTGKTHALGVLTRLLFDKAKRVLICSNTNQAVDQLLLQLCKQMEQAQEPALADGKVLRLGNIDHQDLKAFEDRITPEGIVAHRSEAILARKAEIEAQLLRFNKQVAHAEQIIRLFQEEDAAHKAALTGHNELESRAAKTKDAATTLVRLKRLKEI